MQPSRNSPGSSLLPAVELVATWSQAGSDPGFYWEAVERVMADLLSPAAGPDALAELILGLSSLGAILLDQLAERSGREPAVLLGAINAAYAYPDTGEGELRR